MNTQVALSGKIIAAAFFGVAILAVGAWNFFTHTTEPPSVSESASQEPQALAHQVDTDGDGLQDWEEILLGLDPEKTDSDGNGVHDKEELEAARKRFESQEGAFASATSSEDIAKTDTITREIFGAYIQSKQLGTYDPGAFENIIAQSTRGTFSAEQTPLYTLDDIITVDDTSATVTSAYETAFQKAILSVTDIREYELTTYGRAIETGDEEDFEQLVRAHDVYMSIVEELLAIPVPKDGAVPHLDLINSFASFAQTLNMMAQSPNDPVLAFVSMRNFLEKEDAIKAAYAQIDIYFTLKEAEFGV